MPTTFGEEIAGQGWCTGAVIPHALVPALAPYLVHHGAVQAQVQPDDWLVVVSQTCDVVARKLDAEPFVEVLHCKPIAKLQTQYKDLRSTRILDFKPNRETHEAVVLSAHAVADRYLIPRGLLKDHAPDGDRYLSDVAAQRVLAWYALRYGRPSWPEAFVKRIGKDTAEALEGALEPLIDDIAEVRVGIVEKDYELGEGDTYHVAVYFVVDEVVWNEDVGGRVAIYEAFAKFVSELNGCDGIEVNEELSEVASGRDFTWQETRSTDEWNFANLSYRE